MPDNEEKTSAGKKSTPADKKEESKASGEEGSSSEGEKKPEENSPEGKPGKEEKAEEQKSGDQKESEAKKPEKPKAQEEKGGESEKEEKPEPQNEKTQCSPAEEEGIIEDDTAPEEKEEADLSRRRIIGAGVGGLLVGAVWGAGFTYYRMGRAREPEFTAMEDLMRVHGLLDRIMLIYREIAVRLTENPSANYAIGVNTAALLFRAFGQNYHEEMLEEAYVFPAIRRAGTGAASFTEVLQEQHNLGRQLTDRILADTVNGRIRDGMELSRNLLGFSRMYANHIAREDTIVFPAWRVLMSSFAYKSISEKFQDIERREFGPDGFEQAVAEISAIEGALGYADVTRFNPPAPRPANR